MNEAQTRAVALLDALVEKHANARALRGKTLLACGEEKQWESFPEDWADWGNGWAFYPQPALADALDVKLAERVLPIYKRDANGNKIQRRNVDGSLQFSKNGKPLWTRETVFVWTQGANFAFEEGHTLYNTPQAFLPWEEALSHVALAVQVTEAKPVEPATDSEQRNAGSVTFCLYRPDENKTRLEACEKRTVTQDDFVRFLITGVTRG